MITIATIGDFLAADYRLTAHCDQCRRSADVDLRSLASRLGHDFIIMRSKQPKLRCAKCGSRDCSKTVVAPTWWSGKASRPETRR